MVIGSDGIGLQTSAPRAEIYLCLPAGMSPLNPRHTRPLTMKRCALPILILVVTVALAGCGSSRGPNSGHSSGGADASATVAPFKLHPQAVEPSVGDQAAAIAPSDPVGDVHAHAPTLTQIQKELHAQIVYAPVNGAGYINPLQYVNHWERTDQGVDANMPVGAPILAPGKIKILAVEPDWYAGQPLVYWELLDGRQAGHVQYVAEEITDIAKPGLILQQGQAIARYAASGTGIEFGWSTPNGTTLAVATGGYEEGQVTPAGVWMRQWLNSLGAKAGPS
jgi:hypothetical protein